MILGESLSGKTYFIATVANTLIEAEKIYITPPSNQRFDARDIHKALQNVFDNGGAGVGLFFEKYN